jgi:stage III sporulation protein AB
MFNLLGALLLIAAMVGLAYLKVQSLRAKERALCALLTSLEQMRGELSMSRLPLPELFSLLARQSPKEVGLFYDRMGAGLTHLEEHSLAEIWRRAVESSPELGLGEPERQNLSRLGYSLGRYEAQEQETAISYCIESLERSLALMQEKNPDQARLYMSLGITSGLLLAIMLI